MSKNFILLGDPLLLDSGVSIDLIQGYSLKKPSETQIQAIKDFFVQASPLVTMASQKIFETTPHKKEDKSTKFIPIPIDEWRYSIIEHDFQQTSQEFITALLFSDLNLTPLGEILFTISEKPVVAFLNFQVIPTIVFLSEKSHEHIRQPKISKTDLSELSQLVELLKSVIEDDTKNEVREIIASYRELSLLKKKSYLRTLGLFSIIETLIAHNPSGDYDSITHQFVTKFKLLNRRFRKPLQLNQYFSDGPSDEKILKGLYSFRSKIAHGSFAGFEDNISILGSHDRVVNFVEDFTRRLIVFSIQEPQLISDLKLV